MWSVGVEVERECKWNGSWQKEVGVKCGLWFTVRDLAERWSEGIWSISVEF